jgi:hypothetical protein
LIRLAGCAVKRACAASAQEWSAGVDHEQAFLVDLAAPEEIVSVAASEEAILDEVGKWLRAVQTSKP